MVHRPADSRLFTNLLTCEKDYAKSLKSLLSPSHALSAYAVACTPPLANALLQVSTALGGAEDALVRYADAVEECRVYLKRIKELEEDVGVVVRDREILITRLIKASKSYKNMKSSHRDSLQLNLPVHTGTGSASTLSLSSGFSSPSSSQVHSITLPTTAPSSKLSAAQAELQACEATLAQKERALQLGRVEALRGGLGLRCRALMECGWVWAEVGKEALRALEVLKDGYPPLQGQGSSYTPYHGHGHERNDHPSIQQNRLSYTTEKSLPLPHDHPPCDHAPQYQQLNVQTYYIPPAHAISDSDPFPASSSYHPHQPEQRHVLPRRITEETLRRASIDEDDADGGSSINDPELDLRAIDNPRYFTPERAVPSSSSHGHSPFRLGHGRRRSLSAGEQQTRTPEWSPRKGLLGRKGSNSASPKKRSPSGGSVGASGSGFFGSLKGFFGGGSPGSRASSPVFYEAPESARRSGGGGGGLFGRKKGKGREWETRTERNLRDIERDMRVPMYSPGVRAPTLETEVVVEGAGGAYAHMRESVRGRGRVVSDAGPSPGVREAAPSVEAKRKLKKGRSPTSNPTRKSRGRSSSVPPVGSGGTGAGGLFAGTEIERRHLAALEPQVSSRVSTRPMSPIRSNMQQPLLQSLQPQQVTPTPTPSTVKRQKSTRKPPPTHTERQREEVVKEGYTFTVLGSSNPHLDVTRNGSGSGSTGRRASVDIPPRSQSPVQALSRDNSVRSAASAPVGAVSGQKNRKFSASGKGKVMPSFAGVVGEARDSLVVRYSGQVVGPGTSTVGAGVVKTAQVGVRMEVPKAPPRVGEVLEKEERKEAVVDGLREVRAPGSVFDRVEGLPVVSDSGTALGIIGGQPNRVRGGRESPVSSAVSGSVSAEETGLRKMSRPAMSPLRSALKNPSRTPSPMPGVQVQPQVQSENKENERERGLGAAVLSLSPSPTPAHTSTQLTQLGQPGRPAQVDDGGSSDSGDEVFFEADDGTQKNHDSPRASAPAQPNGTAVGAEESPAPISEPRRRKSVRVSLNPTFSTTPPAIDYDDKDPWASGSGSGWANGSAEGGTNESEKSTWGKNGEEAGDLWEDSSEEDVEYARARSLLSRFGGAGRKEKSKGRA